MSWYDLWVDILGLSTEAPEWSVALVVLAFVFIGVVFPAAAAVSFLERKLAADLQARIGPNRAGRFGILQPLADLFKLLQKEPTHAQSWREEFWLAILTVALYSTAAVLPLGSLALLVDTDMSAFLPFWAVMILSLGMMFLGYNQDSVTGWFSGIRVAAQTLSGAFPGLVALLCAGIASGGYRWSDLARAQGAGPFSWGLFSSPFMFLAFLVFTISGMVILAVHPLDSGFSISDIRGGVAAGFYGRRMGFFRLGRFYGFFLWTIMAVVIFCGGWNLPDFARDAFAGDGRWVGLLELAVVSTKSLALMIFAFGLGRVIPALRADQVTDFTWKVLGPLSLVALIGTALWAGSVGG